jgi:hypothetical protein
MDQSILHTVTVLLKLWSAAQLLMLELPVLRLAALYYPKFIERIGEFRRLK